MAVSALIAAYTVGLTVQASRENAALQARAARYQAELRPKQEAYLAFMRAAKELSDAAFASAPDDVFNAKRREFEFAATGLDPFVRDCKSFIEYSNKYSEVCGTIGNAFREGDKRVALAQQNGMDVADQVAEATRPLRALHDLLFKALRDQLYKDLFVPPHNPFK